MIVLADGALIAPGRRAGAADRRRAARRRPARRASGYRWTAPRSTPARRCLRDALAPRAARSLSRRDREHHALRPTWPPQPVKTITAWPIPGQGDSSPPATNRLWQFWEVASPPPA